MSRTITDTITYTTTSCCVCGVLFALTSDYENARRRDHKGFYAWVKALNDALVDFEAKLGQGTLVHRAD